jgi:hypothetical protein
MSLSGKILRLFVSGTTVLGFGLALGSVSLITGCDSEKSGGQIENAEKPADKSKESMDYYMKTQMKKSKQGVNH